MIGKELDMREGECFLLPFPGIEDTSLAFKQGLVELGQSLMIDPNFLATIMSLESGFDPSIFNQMCIRSRPASECAVGLIQFTKETANRLGTSVIELSQMEDYEQLPYVYDIFQSVAGNIHSAGDAYMWIFLPGAFGKPDDYVLGNKDDETPIVEGVPFTKDAIYWSNPVFDTNQDGVFTVGDVKNYANSHFNKASQASTEEGLVLFDCDTKSRLKTGTGIGVAVGAALLGGLLLLNRRR